MSMYPQFAHLHCHFIGSYSDSVLRFEPALDKVQAAGQPAIALTDHGNLTFVYEFSEACVSRGIRPIFGVELYFVENADECIEKNINERFHLVVLAKNAKGLANLFSLLSDSWLLNSYKERRGLVDWRLLEKYHEGLVALSGCYYNLVAQSVARQGQAAGARVLQRYLDIFGDDYYVEIGRHYIEEEEQVNAGVLELLNNFNITPVLTNDVHYLDPGDWLTHDVVIKTRFDKVGDFKANSQHYWLKTDEEMNALGLPQAWREQTLRIVEKCGPITMTATPLKTFPAIDDPEKLLGTDRAAYLGRMSWIDRDTARRHVDEVLKNDSAQAERRLELIGKIAGIPRRIEPDTERIVYSPHRPLKEIIPLQRSMGKIITQWDEEACRKAGAVILPLTPSDFKDKLLRFFNK